MRAVLSMVLGLAVVLALTATAKAADEEKTLKGSITCAKCDLKLKDADKCATVIKVKEKKDGKDVDVIYYFDAKGDKDNHKDICKGAKDGTVTGKVTEKDGKKIVTVTKLEYKK